MKLKFSPSVAQIQKVSYAKEEEENFLLDCGDGCSPYGCSEKVAQALKDVDIHDVSAYPHGFALKDAIIRRWQAHVPLTYDMLYLHNSGMDAIACVNTIFARPGAAVVGICPQFSDYLLSARCHGFVYRPVYLKQEENFRLIPERVVAAIDDAVSLVYLDNPNNPTGQSVTLDSMRMILDKAKEVGACVISDEAYGDYLAPENSAITLVNEYDNLIVMRSFSKGTGLAGMRAAYVAASPEIITQIDKVSNPYCINGIGRRLAIAALEDVDFIERNRCKLSAVKRRLRTLMGNYLQMAQTLDSCSICLLTFRDPQYDLAKLFASQGVKVVAGTDFEGLGKNSVRLRLPREEDEERLFQIVRNINAGVSSSL